MGISLDDLKKDQDITVVEALDLALRLSEKGRGRVEPNPCVGAVLFNEKTNKLVSWGYHEFYGGPHAEVNCFKDIGDASGLSMVVTLEPCSHFGKTPPCADLVVEKKISKLIYIEKDPNPQVSGKGLEKIRNAGIEVVQADDDYIKRHKIINDRFLYSFINKKSYVHLKWAQSSNGKLGIKNQNIQITSRESQDDAHFLRAQNQMIIVGVDTIIQDDPKLNVRIEGFEKDLMVAVIDPELKLIDQLRDKNISKVRNKGNIFLVTDKDTDNENVIKLPKLSSGFLDLNELSIIAYKEYGVQSLYVEGGARTLKSFIEQEVFNRVSIYESDFVIENSEAISIFDDLSDFQSLIKKKLSLVGSKSIGSDSFRDYILD